MVNVEFKFGIGDKVRTVASGVCGVVTSLVLSDKGVRVQIAVKGKGGTVGSMSFRADSLELATPEPRKLPNNMAPSRTKQYRFTGCTRAEKSPVPEAEWLDVSRYSGVDVSVVASDTRSARDSVLSFLGVPESVDKYVWVDVRWTKVEEL